jgi:nucleotide-binding universal stress UspA family protein
MKPKIFLVTNGCETTWPSVEYAAWLAGVLPTAVTLLGVIEETDEEHPVEAIFGQAVSLFQEKGIEYRLELADGLTEDVIGERQWQPDDLLVIGPLGRPSLRRFLIGRSFRQIMAETSAPILYVPQARIPPAKILICLGGLGYATTVEHLSLKIADVARASVTLFHVVPPIDLDYPVANELQDQWQDLLESDTLPGRNMRTALEMVKESDLPVEVKVQHGNVVPEILDEIRNGDYDMICMGSPHSAHGLRHLYVPNVTAEVAEAIQFPLLTARLSLESKNPM